MLESLADFFTYSYRQNSLGRIFLSQKINQLIFEATNQRVRVVIRGYYLYLYCHNQTSASALLLQRQRLHQLIKQNIPNLKTPRLKISVEPR